VVKDTLATRTLTWNADNMPLTVSRNGTVTTTLTYDGNGARAKKVAGGITTYYVSNNYEIKNGVATKYIFAGNMRVASVEGTNINNSKIFHKDHLGSSTAITDNTGADTETTEYMPFGVQRSHSGANVSDYKYTDQELDNESGLYNYDARMYDPVIGRFISADTVIQSPYNPQTLNRYSYCVNNPMKYTDPSGHIVDTVWDALNIGLGVASLVDNINKGNIGWAAVDAVGIGLDSAAAAVPFIPGGFGTIIKSARAVDKAVDVIESVETGTNIVKRAARAGKNGNPDHIATVERLYKKALKEADLDGGEQILRGKKVKNLDSTRQPDVQIVDKNGKTRKIYEAERKPQSQRNKAREKEYDELGVEHETHPVKEPMENNDEKLRKLPPF